MINERVVQKVDQRVRLVETGKSPRKGKIGATRMFILECAGERECESEEFMTYLLRCCLLKGERQKEKSRVERNRL
jgi:hypothetical protein